MAKVIKGGKVANYNPNKHPRGKHGRFAETADISKSLTGRRSGSKSSPKGINEQSKALRFQRIPKTSLSKTELLKQSMVLNSSRNAAKVYQAKLELYQGLNQDQRRRLQEVLKTKKESKSVTSALPSGLARPVLRGDRPTVAPKVRLKSAPGSRATVKVDFEHNRVAAKIPNNDPTYKIVDNPGHEYQVKHSGKMLTLNKIPRTIEYAGEFTDGVPKLIGDPKSASTELLAKGLARAEKGAKKGTAPTWDTDIHGDLGVPNKLVKHSFIDGKREPLLGMQVHHVDRWAKDPSRIIESDFHAGKITEAERYQRHAQQQKLEIQKDGNVVYKLDIAPQGQRRFVVLAGGVHQGGTPLYQANHPAFLNKDTKEFDATVGLPYLGEGGRQWFNKYRGKFWKEYHRDELRGIVGEINHRVSKGEDIGKIKGIYETELARLTSKVNQSTMEE